MIQILTISGFVATILILIQKTDVIFEYLNILSLSSRIRAALLLTPYQNNKSKYKNILMYWNEMFALRPVLSFFLKLVTCPFCIGIWLAVFFCLFARQPSLIGVVYVTSLLMYFCVDKMSGWK